VRSGKKEDESNSTIDALSPFGRGEDGGKKKKKEQGWKEKQTRYEYPDWRDQMKWGEGVGIT